MNGIIRALVIVAAVVSVGCSLPWEPDPVPEHTTQQQNVNITLTVGTPTPSPSPTSSPRPQGTCSSFTSPASVTIGVLGGIGPAGQTLPQSAPSSTGLPYIAQRNSRLNMDATPRDFSGNRLDCHPPAEGWTAIDRSGLGVCELTGVTTGPDGFIPGLTLRNVGECDVYITVEGRQYGPRRIVVTS